MTKIDILMIVIDAWENDSLIKDIVTYNNNSIIVNTSHDGTKMWISYKPHTITNFERPTIYFLKTKSERLNYYISPILFWIRSFTIFMYLFKISFKFRPRIIISNTYVSAFCVGIIRKCGLCNKSIYLSGDWLYDTKHKSRRWAYIANVFVFPYVDYLACKLNDVVVNCTNRIMSARFKYWNKTIAKKEMEFSIPYRIAASNINLEQINTKICFIGAMRDDCGLDIAIKSLNKLRKYSDFSLIIIGAFSRNYKYFYNLAKQYQVDEHVEFLGFIDRDNFDEILSDCFCGLNMITSTDSYTTYTIPGKSVDYLQYLLPSVSTKNIGDIANMIQKHNLGIIIEPDDNEFITAVLEIYQEQIKFRRNIINFINSSQKLNVRELIEG